MTRPTSLELKYCQHCGRELVDVDFSKIRYHAIGVVIFPQYCFPNSEQMHVPAEAQHAE